MKNNKNNSFEGIRLNENTVLNKKEEKIENRIYVPTDDIILSENMKKLYVKERSIIENCN